MQILLLHCFCVGTRSAIWGVRLFRGEQNPGSRAEVVREEEWGLRALGAVRSIQPRAYCVPAAGADLGLEVCLEVYLELCLELGLVREWDQDLQGWMWWDLVAEWVADLGGVAPAEAGTLGYLGMCG